MIRSEISRFVRGAVLACIAFTVTGVLSDDAGSDRELLAPTGSLRVGVYLSKALETSQIRLPATHLLFDTISFRCDYSLIQRGRF